MEKLIKQLTKTEDPILGRPFAERVYSRDDRIVIDCPYILHADYGGNHARLQQALEQADIDSKNIDFNVNLRGYTNSKHKNLGAIIAVGSGKGGVGKSTLSAALAHSLSLLGARVGLLDADIYGANQDMLMALPKDSRTRVNDDKQFIPFEAHGITLMTFAGVAGQDTPIIWRGPMIANALQQMIDKSAWPQLDYFIVDLPPGTGDIQITLFQQTQVAGFILVTTPQAMALEEAGKTLGMAKKLEVACLGMVENMNRFICPECGKQQAIFGQGTELFREKYKAELLGSIPIDTAIHGDTGQLQFDPQSYTGKEYISISEAVSVSLAIKQSREQGPIIATG